MSKYLLPCDCGAILPVSLSQAGMSIPCPSCGKPVDVPTVRHLTALPQEETSATQGTSTSSRKPSVLLRVLAGIFFIATVACLGHGGYLAYQRYELPLDMSKTEADFLTDLENSLEGLSPADTWDTWNSLAYAGLSSIQTPQYFLLKQAYEQSGREMKIALMIGSGTLLAFLACVVASRRAKS